MQQPNSQIVTRSRAFGDPWRVRVHPWTVSSPELLLAQVFQMSSAELTLPPGHTPHLGRLCGRGCHVEWETISGQLWHPALS